MPDTFVLQHREYLTPGSTDDLRDRQRICHAIILALCVGVLVTAFVLRPEPEGVSLFGYPWPFHCWLHDLLGIRCALCGMSRSFCSLAHGDIRASFGFHPLGPAAFALVCLEVPYRMRALLTRPGSRARWLIRAHGGLVAAVGAAILFYWLFYLGELVL